MKITNYEQIYLASYIHHLSHVTSHIYSCPFYIYTQLKFRMYLTSVRTFYKVVQI